jgi:hypothetical protein
MNKEEKVANQIAVKLKELNVLIAEAEMLELDVVFFDNLDHIKGDGEFLFIDVMKKVENSQVRLKI